MPSRCTTIRQFLCGLRRFVGRTPWSAADALVGPALVEAMLLCGAGASACQLCSLDIQFHDRLRSRDHLLPQRFRLQHFRLPAEAERKLTGLLLHVETNGQRRPTLRVRRSTMLHARSPGSVVDPTRRFRTNADLRVESWQPGLKLSGRLVPVRGQIEIGWPRAE